MLYSALMNNKPNIPEEIGLGKQYSWRASAKAGGGWMMLAFLTDLPGMRLIERHEDWPLALRAGIAMIPLVATLLYVLCTAKWVRGMDELHRRVALESFLFATVAYLFLAAAFFLLNHAGVANAIAQSTGLHLERVPFWNCTFILCLTYIFFGVGYSVLNRRYQ
jgi:hypothetical protein